MEMCRHCLNRPAAKYKRGLCHTCRNKKEIQHLYPSTSKFGKRIAKLPRGRRKTPKPTTARPGSEEKINVLAERLANGEKLFHENDT